MKLQHSKGFTLVEFLLYLGIVGVVILASSMLLSVLLISRVKNQTIAEVEQAGLQAMQTITQTIRNADTITSPTTGTSGSSLTLDVIDAAKDPTVFDLSGGAIRIKEGTASAIVLTNSRVTASAITFHNLSRTGTPGTIRIQFTVTHVNTSGRNEYDFSKTFYGSASLR